MAAPRSVRALHRHCLISITIVGNNASTLPLKRRSDHAARSSPMSLQTAQAAPHTHAMAVTYTGGATVASTMRANSRTSTMAACQAQRSKHKHVRAGYMTENISSIRLFS